MMDPTLPALHLHAGSNDPGFMPDSSPVCFDSWDAAKRYMIGELLMDAENVASWSEPHDCDDIPCPIYGDDCLEMKAADLTTLAEDLNLESGPEWDSITAGRSYWIVVAEEDCDDEDWGGA